KEKILLRYNPNWGDISFVGGKLQIGEEEPLRAAYRITEKELDILGGLDFELELIDPGMFRFERKSHTSGEKTRYIFYPFFLYLKESGKSRLTSPDIRWIELSKARPDYRDSLSVPLSSLVSSVLQQLSLQEKDSFDYAKEQNLKAYREEVILAVNNQASYGFIDDVERRILDRFRKSWQLSELETKKIEHEIISAIKTDDVIEIEHFDLLEEASSGYHKSLFSDLQYYARVKKYYRISIQNVFNEGKTGALVFQIRARKGHESVSRILKYDFYLRIQKEYTNFIENERLHAVFASPKCEQILIQENGFLELQPADDFANAREMNSLRQLFTSGVYSISDDIQRKSLLLEALREILNWLFSKVYQTESKPFLRLHTEYQNAFDHFLPPRWFLDGKILPSGKIFTDKNLIKIPKKNVISYDLKRNNSHIELTVKAWFTQKGSELQYRCDVVCQLSQQEAVILGDDKAWELYVAKGQGQPYRKHFLKKIKEETEWLWKKAEKLSLSSFLREGGEGANSFETGYYLESLLKRSGRIINTSFLHGDFNPSNLLFCRSEASKYYPILIDFYDTGLDGNLFFDLARLEIELVTILLTSYLHNTLGIPLDCKEIQNSELEFILDWEEELFQLKSSSLFSGDFILLELRTIIHELIANYLPGDFSDFLWLKNYYFALGIFGISFQKFQKESNLSRYIALIWAARSMNRVERFQDFIETRIFTNRTQEQYSNKDNKSPVDKLISRCEQVNKLYDLENPGSRIDTELFVDYFPHLKSRITSFLSQNDYSVFFILDEQGSGKSWLLHSYFIRGEVEFPFIFIQGKEYLEDELGYLKKIQLSLKLSGDWVEKISESDLKGKDIPFCIIMENITDNSKPTLARDALKVLLRQVKDSKVKVLVTGEPWFWDEVLEGDEFVNHIAFRNYLDESKRRFTYYSNMEQAKGVHQNLLIQNYFRKYKIRGELSGKALEIVEKPGFLRLFAEVMQNKIIGTQDFILWFDIMQAYVHNKFKEIQKDCMLSLEVIRDLAYSISGMMNTASTNILSIIDVLESIPLEIRDVTEANVKSFIISGMKVKFFQNHNTRLSFVYPDVLPFLNSGRIVREWSYSRDEKQEVANWLESNLYKITENTTEYLISNIARHQFNLKNKDGFEYLFESLLKKFRLYPVPILRIFSKTIPALPYVPSKLIKYLNELSDSLERLDSSDKNKMHHEIEAFHRRLQNVDYSEDAKSWISQVEKVSREEIATFYLNMSEYEFSKFLLYLENGDTRKGEKFTKTFIFPCIGTFSKNLSIYTHENIDRILVLYGSVFELNKDLNYDNIISVYDLFTEIVQHDKHYLNTAIRALATFRIQDISSFRRFSSLIAKWLSFYATELGNRKAILSVWIPYIITYYNRLSNPVDYEAYQSLLSVLPSGDELYNLGLNEKFATELANYLTKNLPISITLYERLAPNLSIPNWKREIDKNRAYVETQNVVYVLIKYKESILLQYNPSWEDYNWPGKQLNTEGTESAKILAREILSSKFILSYPGDFEVEEYKRRIPVFENYSRSRAKLVRYTPYLFIVKLNDKSLMEKILDDMNNILFSVKDFQNSSDIVLSLAVRKILSFIKQDWERLPECV
ncbi:MAG: hypothetical protein KDK45_09150, partial [Leptospiraceae bacterium]|nr:hypothetical protein [Leptospiraceae bacterium]